MATFTTLAEARTAMLANADYRSTGSVSKAKAFADAVEAVIVLLPSESEHSGEKVSFEISEFRKSQQAALAWLNVNDTGGSAAGAVRHFSFEDFRS